MSIVFNHADVFESIYDLFQFLEVCRDPCIVNWNNRACFSIEVGLMQRVTGSMSANRNSGPFRVNASAVVTKVKDGTITLVLGVRFRSIEDNSSALVQDVVKRTALALSSDRSRSLTFAEKGPLAAEAPVETESRT